MNDLQIMLNRYSLMNRLDVFKTPILDKCIKMMIKGLELALNDKFDKDKRDKAITFLYNHLKDSKNLNEQAQIERMINDIEIMYKEIKNDK